MADRTAPTRPTTSGSIEGPHHPDTIRRLLRRQLSTEIHVSEHRNGNDPEPHVQKFAGIHKAENVTCKRGLVNSLTLGLITQRHGRRERQT
jgi:hypothetical protein